MSTEQRFEVLLFDLGGVLMDFAGFDELAQFMPESPGRSEIRDRWIRCEAVRRFERGEIARDEFATSVIRELQIDLTPSDFLTKFVEWAREPSAEAISLLRRLGREYRIAALSNANELHTPLHRRRFKDVIDTFYFSDEIGAVKPDREIYEHVIRDLGLPPHRIAFFDDTPVNVEAAREAGLIAYAVDGIADLTTRLQNLGIADHLVDDHG
jgi:HAD superfamily hydrolase (TIGR01509 family)